MSTFRERSAWITLGGIAIALVAVIAIMGVQPKPAIAADRAQSLAAVQALSYAFEQVSSDASPAVVNISVEKKLKESPMMFEEQGGAPMDPDDLFRRFFGGPPMGGHRGMPHAEEPDSPPVPVGVGSGFIISPDGYIVTNHHVAGDADKLTVTLEDGRSFEAKVIGSDPQTEIALIKVEATGLPTLKLGNSDQVRVGEWVLAIGSPFGLRHSVTSGIVSARGRGDVNIVDYADFIQTDASINPGNSGGPLLDMQGEVIGVNTFIMSRGGGSNGVGFAIPANMVKYIVDQLREHGSITRGFLGINIQEVTPELAKWFKLTGGHGVLVANVTKDSPAEKAGLQRDDVIVELDGQPVLEVGAFRSHVSTTTPGTALKLAIIRGGNRIEKTIEVGSLPGEKTAKAGGGKQQEPATKLGITVQGLSDDLAKRMGYEGETGVVVSQVTPGSGAARAGIKAGMLIKEVNRQAVNNPREFEEAIQKGPKDQSALLLIQDGQSSRYVALDVS
jgi:serine protease Do